MPKVITFLNENTIQNLKKLCMCSGKSLSKVTSDLVEIGYQASQNNDTRKVMLQDKSDMDFALKDREYLLRILNIDSEILRKLYDEPSKCTGKTVDLKLAEIQVHAKNHVETKLKN
jgi:hypothetical protein